MGTLAGVAGGGIYGYFINISGGVISNNEATTVGGGIWGAGTSQVTIGGNAEISNNSVISRTPPTPSQVTPCGGGVAVDSNSTFIIEGNAVIKNNSALNGGGVSLISRGDATAATKFTMRGGGVIDNNTAYENGGGVYVYCAQTRTDFVFNMEGGTISSNKAAVHGGGIYGGTNAILNICGGQVSGNKTISSAVDEFDTVTYGGGIYKTGAGTFTMTGGEVSSNEAISGDGETGCYGGGVFLDKSSFVMGTDGGNNDSVIIKDNTANYMGGGVHVRTSSTMTMYCGTISGNKSLSGADVTYGGGVEVYGGSRFTMKNGLITGNQSTGESGGVEVYDDSSFTMNGGSITNNSSASGGGVGVGYEKSTFTMTGGTISGNGGSWGGAVYLHNEGIMTVTKGEITGNNAQYGGGIFTNIDTVVDLNNCSIKNNTVATDGGAIYSVDTDYKNLKTSGSTDFADNTAGDFLVPEGNPDVLYPNIRYGTVSDSFLHPLNNYDINTIFTALPICHITFDSAGGSRVPDQKSFLDKRWRSLPIRQDPVLRSLAGSGKIKTAF